ncbi:hypothetical protein AB1Y20_001173 [Prymnesium parvum]|uniref:Major facilitator superfamily (MFS) profile domain-containing protein n=1 Tax=Prymnesium parvum TaxID=97485 RepID=A0AB34KAH5_PRYPA
MTATHRSARSTVCVLLLLVSGTSGYASAVRARPQLGRHIGRSAGSPLAHAALRGSLSLPRHSARGTEVRCSGGNEPQSSKYTLYPSRWVQLGYLSVLALLSDWVCFSVAAAPDVWEATYGHDPATLIDIFLFTNVLFCFLEPTIVRKVGLRAVIVGGAFLMTAGCLLRSGIPFTGAEPVYAQIIAGTVLVGAAQPFFQCTPPLLSATWFGYDERALSTAVAINFNQVGIATAFLIGGVMVTDGVGISHYFDLISTVCLTVSLGALVQFKDRPITPPSSSAAARIAAANSGLAEEDTNFVSTARMLLATPGFVQPLVAFVGSIAVSNVVSAFVKDILVNSGMTSQSTIILAGAGFQAAIVIGGIVLGGYVDQTKRYKEVTLACFGISLLLLQPLGFSNCPSELVLVSLLALGALIGPVQPINAELAVEVAYPADENSIEALQQLCGNLFSALLVPLAEIAATRHTRVPGIDSSVSGDSMLLSAIVLGAFLYYRTFTSALKRSAIDCVGDDVGPVPASCEVVLTDVDTTNLPALAELAADDNTLSERQ